MKIKVTKLCPGAITPTRAYHDDAGADLYAVEDVTLLPGQQQIIPTGISLEIPTGYVGLVHPRSGLAARYGVTVVNTPGTIDASYRGEIMVIMRNLNTWGDPVMLPAYSRIAQLVIQKVELPDFVLADSLIGSARGTGGLGSTGA